ncbi:hypothetical protein K438DRAFT_2063149 [Mycena galopus ATCC 62051]|nr:hypothetical protein K438DRAFT_2063149 [Mycena galopus ATCC 62051]
MNARYRARVDGANHIISVQLSEAKGTYRTKRYKSVEEVGEGLARVVEVGLKGRQGLPTSPCQMAPNLGTDVSADSVSADHRPRQWAANRGRPGLWNIPQIQSNALEQLRSFRRHHTLSSHHPANDGTTNLSSSAVGEVTVVAQSQSTSAASSPSILNSMSTRSPASGHFNSPQVLGRFDHFGHEGFGPASTSPVSTPTTTVGASPTANSAPLPESTSTATSLPAEAPSSSVPSSLGRAPNPNGGSGPTSTESVLPQLSLDATGNPTATSVPSGIPVSSGGAANPNGNGSTSTHSPLTTLAPDGVYASSGDAANSDGGGAPMTTQSPLATSVPNGDLASSGGAKVGSGVAGWTHLISFGTVTAVLLRCL